MGREGEELRGRADARIVSLVAGTGSGDERGSEAEELVEVECERRAGLR